MSISKTATITDGSTELEIPIQSFQPRSSNNLNSFNRPDKSGGDPETRALNLNRIETKVTVSATVSDAFASKNHNGNGDRPDLSNREEWLAQLWDLYVSTNQLTLSATNSDTLDRVSVFDGYISAMDWNHEMSEGNNVYSLELEFLEANPMNS